MTSGRVALVEFMILGPTRLRLDDGRYVPLGAAKQRALLTLLLFHVRQPVPVDLIVERLWNDQRSDEHREKLYPLASRIRTVLRREGVPARLSTTPGADYYRLDAADDLIDLHRFRRLDGRARDATRAGQHAVAAGLFAEALELWHEPPLAELRSDGAEHDRHHLREQVMLGACKGLFDSQLAVHEYQAVVARLAPLVEERPLDETLVRQWIEALEGAGRFTEANRFYLAFERRWRAEVSRPPGPEVRTAYRQLLSRREKEDPEPVDAVAPARFLAPHQLPRDISDFIGHERLLAKLDALTDPAGEPAGVVVIDGAPGVGKTTLATHWAHRHLNWFPDGQLYLNANAYGPTPPVGADDALGHFLHSVGVPTERIPPTGELRRIQLGRLLTDRRLLIFVDNALDSQQIRPLLAATGRCLMLITSRSKLPGLTIREGQQSLTVRPLEPDESVAMLRGTIGRERADREPDATKRLALLSSGLPLALRIIGHHVVERPQVPLADLVDQLQDDLLAPEDEFDEEEATVRTVFTWSYRALPPQAAELFRLLGVHPARSISVAAAAALLGVGAARTERLLETLARTNLIEHGAAPRRYQLHDLLQRYAADRAHGVESRQRLQVAIRRMVLFYLLTSSRAVGMLAPARTPVPDLPAPEGVELRAFPTDDDAMHWCEEERQNITAVTRSAAEHGLHRFAWQLSGTVHEIFERSGNQDDVLECQQIAVRSARLDRHPEGQIGSLSNLAATHFHRGDFQRAAGCFAEGLKLAEDFGHRGGQAVCLHGLGAARLEQDDPEAAVALYGRALTAYRDVGDRSGEAFSLHRLGNAYRRSGDYLRAFAHHREALAIREELRSYRGQAATHAEMATAYLELGRLMLAIQHAERAVELHDRSRDQAATCDALITMATARCRLGSFGEAIQAARRAVAMSEDATDERLRSRALEVLATAEAASTGG